MTAFGNKSLAAAGSEGDKVNEHVEQEDWRHRCERIWKRVGEAVYEAVHAVLGPPPSDVIEGIEDFMGLARCNQEQKKEILKCRDAVNEKWLCQRPSRRPPKAT